MKQLRNAKGQFTAKKKETGETLLQEIHGEKRWWDYPANVDYKSIESIKTLIGSYKNRIDFAINLFSRVRKASLMFGLETSYHNRSVMTIIVNILAKTIQVELNANSELEYIENLRKNLKELEDHLELLRKEL